MQKGVGRDYEKRGDCFRMILINPGSGPVANASFKEAENNIHFFINDCATKDIKYIALSKQYVNIIM